MNLNLKYAHRHADNKCMIVIMFAYLSVFVPNRHVIIQIRQCSLRIEYIGRAQFWIISLNVAVPQRIWEKANSNVLQLCLHLSSLTVAINEHQGQKTKQKQKLVWCLASFIMLTGYKYMLPNFYGSHHYKQMVSFMQRGCDVNID